MKTKFLSLIVVLLGAGIAKATPLDATFTYQGRLTSGTNVANGYYDVRFTLHDAVVGGGQIAGPLTNAAVTVSNGLFTVGLNFGAASFAGESRWLELSIRTNGSGSFTLLSPRQALTAAPYAVYAPAAGTANTATLANTVGLGAVSTLGLQNNAVDSLRIADGSITSSDLSSSLLNDTFWRLLGNGGTTPGVNFLGTTDNQALELKVNYTRALRLEPDSAGAPNLIGGAPNNAVLAGSRGATIGGGATNTIGANLATIGGGARNQVGTGSGFDVSGSVIGGGVRNFIDHQIFCSIAGGASNTIAIGYMTSSAIGGGSLNSMSESSFSVVAGGYGNSLFNSSYCVIGGGAGNTLTDSYNSVIAGGTGNDISIAVTSGIPSDSAIGGGQSNTVYAAFATISGGAENLVTSFAQYGAIGGGSRNALQFSPHTTIGGGIANTNQGAYALIGGGAHNSILELAAGATIGGGATNIIEGDLATISGGSENSALGSLGTIGGGTMNYLGANAIDCTIGGGSENLIHVGNLSASTIGGGTLNQIGQSSHSMIGGGYNNQMLNSDRSFIGGGLGNDIDESGSSVIAGGEDNSVFAFDSFRSCSTIGGGLSNQVDRPFATIPGGKQAKARNYGQMAYAAGAFATPGDSQTSTYVCRNTTTNATQTDLFLDGSSALINLMPNSTWAFDILITGRTSTGSSAGYQIRGVIENNGGASALVGALNKLIFAEDVAAWDATVIADNANDALVVQVTGAAATTVRWVASVRTVEISY